MQAKFIKEWFAKLPDDEQVIAFWWSKDDVESNAGSKPMTEAQWIEVVASMQNSYYDGILVDYMTAFTKQALAESGEE